MQAHQIKTRKFIPPKDSLAELLAYIPRLKDKSIVAISSKVISITEGQTRPVASISHDALINQLAESFLEPIKRGTSDTILTQVGNILVESAGVDLSNGDGYYVLLPKKPYKSAKAIWSYLRKRDKLKHLGVVITDSHSVPRRKGAEGFALASYGFKASHVYEEEKDIFGRKFHFTAADIADSLAATAVLVMGEGGERTPIAVITDLENVEFFNKVVPLVMAGHYAWTHPNYDVYSPLLKKSLWRTSLRKP